MADMLLRRHLRKLTLKEKDRFRFYLVHLVDDCEYERIPHDLLKNAAPWEDVVSTMISTYGTYEAGRVAVRVLRTIGSTDAAEDLEHALMFEKERVWPDFTEVKFKQTHSSEVVLGENVSTLLLEHIEKLCDKDYDAFTCQLSYSVPVLGTIPYGLLSLEISKKDLVTIMVNFYGPHRAARVTVLILEKIKQNVLSKRLARKSEAITGFPIHVHFSTVVDSSFSRTEDVLFGSLQAVSSDKGSSVSYPACSSCADVKDLDTCWKQLCPEAWSEDGELLPDTSGKEEYCKYKIGCSAGSHECTVTGLRWVCDDDVILEYRYLDWETYRGDLERMQYEPRGPAIDITVISGTLKEVHLPHFVCLDSSVPLNDAARVLDVQDSGMILEPCELTRFHAKLYNPTFSPKIFLIKNGFSVKTHCEVLIYQMLKAHLTLHVYLVPCDLRMLQAVKEVEKDAERIPKPRPESSLLMNNLYKLETKKEKKEYPSTITNPTLKLRYTTITPNYFEVYIKDAKEDFELHLTNEENELVWKAEIRAEEFNKNSMPFANWFYKKHQAELIQRVSVVDPIADDLKSLIGDEQYCKIITLQTSQEKMRKLCSFLSGALKIQAFFQSLLKYESLLVLDLAKKP